MAADGSKHGNAVNASAPEPIAPTSDQRGALRLITAIAERPGSISEPLIDWDFANVFFRRLAAPA
jgi:hypothetical protein